MPTDLRAHAEALIAAIDAADCGHSMRLTRLVDGEETYTVTVGDQTAELPGADESYEWIREVKAKRKADAILTALAALHDEAARAALEAAASKSTSFLVGAPHDGIPLRNPMSHEIADAIHAIDPASLREGA
jgi:hypothetical protein